ncbi:MAG TPA: heavy metal translocating P-type ATPase, partial [Chitinophagales bacterium]|nr:heavy metal translocating P-type ATPase [Chitinophagales bacterium]
KAQVSISFSNATQVAIQSAKVVLLQDKLPLIKEVISLSQRTMRIIRQNLFWAFFYNILMLPLAAVGWLNPMWAAAAMSLSSLMVVFNSLRLR